MEEHEREEAAIGAAVAHLTRRFKGKIPDPELEAAVRSCFGQWPEARVRDFIPILAERCAQERVRRRPK